MNHANKLNKNFTEDEFKIAFTLTNSFKETNTNKEVSRFFGQRPILINQIANSQDLEILVSKIQMNIQNLFSFCRYR